MLPNEMINVIGVVQLLGPTQFAIGSLKTSKKEIVIADLEASVAVTLWGDDAESFAGTQGDVVTFDRIQVSVYQGKITLSAVTRTVITESPTTPAALEFKRQWDALDD
jgi:ssDNA-binding replication factor A large subunit